MSLDPDLLKHAKLVRRYASETGKLAPDLAIAIKCAEDSVASSSQDIATIEAQILRAQSEAIKLMGISNINVIKTWYSPQENGEELCLG